MGLSPGLGHNNGPTLEPGASWRRISWQNARTALLPTLPIEVVRLRVRRAAALGLPYKTYASVRASTGQDVIGFLFSSNALRLMQSESAARLKKLESVEADRTAVVYRPFTSEQVSQLGPIDAAFAAPEFTLSWSAMREHLQRHIRARGIPSDRVLLIGDTAFERDWADAARLAGFVRSDLYFAGTAS